MPPKILVVDDEPDLRKIIKRGLELSGCDIDSSEDPACALKAFQPGKYDMVILDVGMPEMSGFELYERLTKLDSNVKVCFLTAYDMEYFREFRMRFPDIPDSCFIRKPVAIKDLAGIVKAQLTRPTG
jgi:DNA-binding response OmpR family regulator